MSEEDEKKLRPITESSLNPTKDLERKLRNKRLRRKDVAKKISGEPIANMAVRHQLLELEIKRAIEPDEL